MVSRSLFLYGCFPSRPEQTCPRDSMASKAKPLPLGPLHRKYAAPNIKGLEGKETFILCQVSGGEVEWGLICWIFHPVLGKVEGVWERGQCILSIVRTTQNSSYDWADNSRRIESCLCFSVYVQRFWDARRSAAEMKILSAGPGQSSILLTPVHSARWLHMRLPFGFLQVRAVDNLPWLSRKIRT